jgi:hypothetical protein
MNGYVGQAKSHHIPTQNIRNTGVSFVHNHLTAWVLLLEPDDAKTNITAAIHNNWTGIGAFESVLALHKDFPILGIQITGAEILKFAPRKFVILF